MNLDEVIAKVQASAPDLRIVGGSIQLAAAEETLRTTPAAFVLAATESSAPNTLGAGSVSQVVTVTFSVVLAVANYSDTTGKAGHDALQALRLAILTGLIGWMPTDAIVEVTHQQGRLAHYNNSTMWWDDTFETQILRRYT